MDVRLKAGRFSAKGNFNTGSKSLDEVFGGTCAPVEVECINSGRPSVGEDLSVVEVLRKVLFGNFMEKRAKK